MQKAYRHVCAVVGRIILIGLTFQIILGFLWMCTNFGRYQDFRESRIYIECSRNFLLDEYTGALYPVILMLARGIEALLHIPYTYFIHLIQLVAALASSFFFLKSVGIKNLGYKVYGSLAILTIPMAMQCHLAVLPNSLALSALLSELAFVVEAVKGHTPLTGKQLIKANWCWVLSALLLPDYLWLGGVPVSLLWMYDGWKYRRTKQSLTAKGALQSRVTGVLRNFLVIVAFAGIIVLSGELVQNPGCLGRPAKTVEGALFRRLNWGDFMTEWDNLPEDMRESCSYWFTMETTLYAENMELMLQPRLEASVGLERAREIYRELNVRALERNFSVILRQTAWDAAGYLAPSVALRMFLAGRGYDSLAGSNYEMMRGKTPLLTKYYVNFSGWWLAAGIVLAAVAGMLSWFSLRQQNRKRKSAAALLCVITAGFMILWYTMQGAGVWDYKNGLFTGVLWVVWMLLEAQGCTEEQ